MIKISSEELKDLEYINSGKFGKVYKKDDHTAYKIYYKKIADESGRERDNPCLFLSKARINRIINRSKELSFTGGVLDRIIVDRSFGGVVVPYFEGDTLHNCSEIPIRKRIDIAKQYVSKSKELTNHLIYPTDYKLNNVILGQDGELHIIDLDDVRTHPSLFPNPVYHALTVSGLNECMWDIFDLYDYCSVPRSVRKEIYRPHWHVTAKYNTVDSFIEDIEKPRTFVFIDDKTDLDFISTIADVPNFHYVYVLDYDGYETPDEAYFLSRLQKCKEKNIPIFDFVKRKDLDKYSSMFVTENEFEVENNYVKTRR